MLAAQAAYSNLVTLGSILSTIAICTTIGLLLWWLFRRLSHSLRGVVDRANQSITDMNTALARIEMIETRLNATEHRLAVLERYQLRVLDAEATVRGAGIHVPPPG